MELFRTLKKVFFVERCIILCSYLGSSVV